MTIDRADAMFLLGRPEFRRFLYAAIQSAGLLGHTSGANGQSGRDLGFYEGRRSLGFEMLAMVDQGQPDALQSPEALATINSILIEHLNPAPAKEKPDGRRSDHNRYDAIDE